MRRFLGIFFGVLVLSCLSLQAQTAPTALHFDLTSSGSGGSVAASKVGLPDDPRPQRDNSHGRQGYGAIGFALPGSYSPDPSIEDRLSIVAVHTPFLSESTYFITHLWKGLELDGFDNTVHAESTQFGWLASGGSFQAVPASNHDQASVGTSTETYGASLRYTFGHAYRSEESKRSGRDYRR